MPRDPETADVSLRRRLLCAALNIKPGDLRQVTGAHAVRVTSVLNGVRNLRPEETRSVTRLFSRRARALFGADE